MQKGSTPKSIHRQPRPSTTLNRKYVRRPSTSDIIRSPHSQSISKPSAYELKDLAIKKALSQTLKNTSTTPPDHSSNLSTHFGFKRILLAFSCTAIAIFGLIYFINLNIPDLSLRVAAMQSGIEATYPSFIPRGFNLDNINSENGKITLSFFNPTSNTNFSLSEEKTSWDSNTLLKNFVQSNYEKDYITIREQGLTLYIDNTKATWVNGGILYKITISSGSLTKKQIRMLAVSL